MAVGSAAELQSGGGGFPRLTLLNYRLERETLRTHCRVVEGSPNHTAELQKGRRDSQNTLLNSRVGERGGIPSSRCLTTEGGKGSPTHIAELQSREGEERSLTCIAEPQRKRRDPQHTLLNYRVGRGWRDIWLMLLNYRMVRARRGPWCTLLIHAAELQRGRKLSGTSC